MENNVSTYEEALEEGWRKAMELFQMFFCAIPYEVQLDLWDYMHCHRDNWQMEYIVEILERGVEN